jgi:hypothetical protein
MHMLCVLNRPSRTSNASSSPADRPAAAPADDSSEEQGSYAATIKLTPAIMKIMAESGECVRHGLLC